MKRFSLIIILLSLVCGVTAQAQSRGYTSTQTTATGGGGSSLDALINGKNTQPKKKVVDDDLTPVKPKEKAYIPPTRAAKSKTVKDDRQVIVTKDAFDTDNHAVKTTLPPKLVAPSNKVKAPLASLEKAKAAFDSATISPTQRAPQ